MQYAIREFDRPRRVLLEGKSDSVHALDDIGFAATPRGTRITYTADISLLGASRIVEPLLKGALDRVGRNAVRGLQAALSGESPPPGRSRLTDLQDRLIVPGLLGFTNAGYHWHKRSWKPLAVSLRDRTVVVTGATSGLGQAAALAAGRARRARDPGGSQSGQGGRHPA